MALNLSKNGVELMAAYKEVVDDRSDTNWALFTYEGNSNTIRLAGKGDGGLEEMVEELNSGKVMYAFCRVLDPNSGLPKYVLINWTGEGVRDSQKGLCANHLSSVANFLKGAHLTINARDEDDVEPDTILSKVSKASGANYNFHKTTQQYADVPRGPVGSVYRKINAVDEIHQTEKDTFWAQSQREEESRRQQEVKRAELQRQTLDQERRAMEEKETNDRDIRVHEKATYIDELRKLEKQREEEDRGKEQLWQGSVYRKINAVDEIHQTEKDTFWAQSQREEESRRQQEVKRAELQRQTLDQERRAMEEKETNDRDIRVQEKAMYIDELRKLEKQREGEDREKEELRQNYQEKENTRTGGNIAASVHAANEAKALISQRSFNPRDVFKQREQSLDLNYGRSPSAPRAGKLQSPFLSQTPFESPSILRPQTPPSQKPFEVPTSPRAETPPFQKPLEIQSPWTPPSSSWTAPSSSPPARNSPDMYHGGFSYTAPPVVPAADAAEDDDWSDESDNNLYEASPRAAFVGSLEKTLAAPPADRMFPLRTEDNMYQVPRAVGERQGFDDIIQDAGTAEVDDGGQNICARAVYDYQAADDTEITFDPGDIIKGIQTVDEGWWRGYGPDGHYGMFPANYVELL
ncbi:drebrin-like a isoform X1 [Entelurus aequoreus]|uniref:drebrin-like a isoform X1 n=1 Tax=Entelurus aequoreus TaxID=161455 RepID=UPI002B1D0BA8|nr:drebrin-like a isoform X1 [Entelurus aequoreus]